VGTPGNINLRNDFVIGPDRALYVSDAFDSRIFRLRPGASEPELLIEDRTLDGIDGITFLAATLRHNVIPTIPLWLRAWQMATRNGLANLQQSLDRTFRLRQRHFQIQGRQGRPENRSVKLCFG